MSYSNGSYITRNNTQEQQSANQSQAQNTAQFADNRTTTAAQLQQQSIMASSPAVTAQLMLMGKMAASPIQQKTIQRAGPEEELQMKSAMPAQLAEDEELLQGKFATAQLAEDEELLQGKFATAQRAEDEELLQGKFATAQRAEDEELLQGKFATAQLATAQLVGEEELLQGKFEPAQRAEKANNTGLPDNLKSGIESLSGMSMDHVNVHYNSDKPAQLNAHAYAQGADIHVAPGQEQHLPHEAWHVVQQAQGRVKPTTQMKGTSVNDDVGLETEADVMGAKALGQMAPEMNALSLQMHDAALPIQNNPIQRAVGDNHAGSIKRKPSDSSIAINVPTAIQPWFVLPADSGMILGDTVTFTEAAGRAVTVLVRTGHVDTPEEVAAALEAARALTPEVYNHGNSRVLREHDITNGVWQQLVGPNRAATDYELVVTLGGVKYSYHFHAPNFPGQRPIAGQVMIGNAMSNTQTPVAVLDATMRLRGRPAQY